MAEYQEFYERLVHASQNGGALQGSEFAGGGIGSFVKKSVLGAGRAALQAGKHVYNALKPVLTPVLTAAANRVIDRGENALWTGIERGNIRQLPHSVGAAVQHSFSRQELSGLRRQLAGGARTVLAGRRF